MIYKLLVNIIIFCTLIFNVSYAVNLQIPDDHTQADLAVVGPTQIEANESNLFNLINLINDYLWFSIGIICLGALIYGGIGLITSQGSEDKMKKANKILMGALIGILIAIFSYSIIRLVVNLF